MKTSLFLFALFFSVMVQGKGIDDDFPVPCEYFSAPGGNRCGGGCMGMVTCSNQEALVMGYLNENDTLLKGLTVVVTDKAGTTKKHYIHFHRFSQNNSLANFVGSSAEANMAEALEQQGIQLKYGDRIQVALSGYIFPSSATLYKTQNLLGKNQPLGSAVQSAINKPTQNKKTRIICEYAGIMAPIVIYDKGCRNKKICHANFRCLDTETDIMFEIKSACPIEGKACPREATSCVVNQISYQDNGDGVPIK